MFWPHRCSTFGPHGTKKTTLLETVSVEIRVEVCDTVEKSLSNMSVIQKLIFLNDKDFEGKLTAEQVREKFGIPQQKYNTNKHLLRLSLKDKNK